MCCGKNRQQLRAPSANPVTTQTVRQNMPLIPRAPQPAVAPVQPSSSLIALRYLRRSPIRVRGPVTGRVYDFSVSNLVQPVDSRDAAALVRTNFFRQD
jgi:hypothetical protein